MLSLEASLEIAILSSTGSSKEQLANGYSGKFPVNKTNALRLQVPSWH
jgi:hypothetical protein